MDLTSWLGCLMPCANAEGPLQFPSDFVMLFVDSSSLSHFYSTIATLGVFHSFRLQCCSEFCVSLALGYSCLALVFPNAFTRDAVHDII
jgi:hypothetical protein